MRRRTLDIILAPAPENYILGTCTEPFSYTYGDQTLNYDGVGDFRLDFEYPTATSLKDMFLGISGGSKNYTACISTIDLSHFDTSNVTNMSKMFNAMYFMDLSDNEFGLTNINLSNFNTSNVTNMFEMFRYNYMLTALDVSSFDTSKVTNMGGMFQQLSIEHLDVSNFNTSKVTNMGGMFDENSLSSLDLSNFDTSNVTDMSFMFNQCLGLMFLDLSNFDISKVTKMSNMLQSCDKLSHIKCKTSFRDWCWANADTIKLPGAMKEGGSGTWELVD